MRRRAGHETPRDAHADEAAPGVAVVVRVTVTVTVTVSVAVPGGGLRCGADGPDQRQLLEHELRALPAAADGRAEQAPT